MSEKCKSCTGILGRLCPSAAKEILPPITSAPVTQDPSAALPSWEPLYTLSFFVNIFFKGPFFERINAHSILKYFQGSGGSFFPGGIHIKSGTHPVDIQPSQTFVITISGAPLFLLA